MRSTVRRSTSWQFTDAVFAWSHPRIIHLRNVRA